MEDTWRTKCCLLNLQWQQFHQESINAIRLAHQEQLARAQCAKISEMTEAAEQASEKRSREVKELKEEHAKHMEALRQFNKQAIDELKQSKQVLR